MSKLTLEIWALASGKEYKFKDKQTKPIKKISDKKIKRLKDFWTEVELFKIKFDMLKWNTYCCVSGKYISEPKAECFAHILSKKDYPQYRYYLNNIALVYSIKEHLLLDELVTNLKRTKWHQWLEEQIKNNIILFN